MLYKPEFPFRLQQAVQQGQAELSSEREFLTALGLTDAADDVHRLYTLAMMAELFAIPLAEIRRLLRPGGTYVMWDFPTATPEAPGYGGFAGLMDAADNGEPYAYGFVKCGIEGLLAEAGLKLRSLDKADLTTNGRVCDAA